MSKSPQSLLWTPSSTFIHVALVEKPGPQFLPPRHLYPLRDRAKYSQFKHQKLTEELQAVDTKGQAWHQHPKAIMVITVCCILHSIQRPWVSSATRNRHSSTEPMLYSCKSKAARNGLWSQRPTNVELHIYIYNRQLSQNNQPSWKRTYHKHTAVFVLSHTSLQHHVCVKIPSIFHKSYTSVYRICI